MQKSFQNKKNNLYIVSTPIGNLKDITYRAVETLKEVDIVFAEDTRVSKILFNQYNINTPMKSYYEERKYEKQNDVLFHLEKGDNVALISDAGTPGISDPGFELIKTIIQKGYNIVSIPGATASITALTSSGLSMQPHLFIGFLPRKEKDINSILLKYERLDATLIFYESPHRIQNTLNYIYNLYGDRKVVISRELTKIYETVIRGSLRELKDNDFINKGEYVILVEGYKENIDLENVDIIQLVEKYKLLGFTEKIAMKKVAEKLKISRRDVYQKYKIEKK